jgi:hypothetical protein
MRQGSPADPMTADEEQSSLKVAEEFVIQLLTRVINLKEQITRALFGCRVERRRKSRRR